MKHALMIDYDHIGRVLAARQRVGPGYLYDVRERAKARRAQWDTRRMAETGTGSVRSTGSPVGDSRCAQTPSPSPSGSKQ